MPPTSCHHSRAAGARRPVPALAIASLVVLTGLLAGCGRPSVAVYEAPKDQRPPASPHAHGSGHGTGAGDLASMPAPPEIRWTSVPDGWTSRGPSGMRVANFSVPGASGASAELAVIPLPGTGGSDLDLVNLWRGQLNLPPVEESALPAHTDVTEIAGQQVKLFTIVGGESSDSSAAGNQILVAALRRDGFTWFFKMAGDAPTVEGARSDLKAFLAGLEFSAPPAAVASRSAPTAPQASPGTGEIPLPRWEVPSSWQAAEAPQMVRSKWIAPGSSAGPADVTVSVFPGETGGLTANLNRWRAQVGLGPAPDSELTALADNFDVLGGKATLADFSGSSPESGDPMRLVAAIVRRAGLSWFYKMMGPPETVESHREAFLKFVQSATYPPRS